MNSTRKGTRNKPTGKPKEGLYKKILQILENHDGLCMDNDREREKLARALLKVLEKG